MNFLGLSLKRGIIEEKKLIVAMRYAIDEEKVGYCCKGHNG